MSYQDVPLVGYPKTAVKRDWEFSTFCGGMGGGTTVVQTGVTHYRLEIDVDTFSVKNLGLILRNLSFTVWKSATWNGVAYVPVAGTEVPFHIYASSRGSLVTVIGDPITGEPFNFCPVGGEDTPAIPPYDLEFTAKQLPQPKESAYAGKIYVYFYWCNTSYWWRGTPIGNEFQVLKIDNEVKI